MLKYNVWIYNINRQKMKVFNVFEHDGFLRGIKNILLEKNYFCSSIKDFSEQLKTEAMYYFWAKAEWEIVIQPWCGCRDVGKTAEKIDVYVNSQATYILPFCGCVTLGKVLNFSGPQSPHL